MRPPAPWSLASLRTLKALSGAAPGGGHAGGDEGDGVGPHGQAADGRRLGGHHREHGVGHEHHGLGPAHRLLGVDEPGAGAARLEGELAALDRVAEQVPAQLGVAVPAHSKRTPAAPAATSPTTLAG